MDDHAHHTYFYTTTIFSFIIYSVVSKIYKCENKDITNSPRAAHMCDTLENTSNRQLHHPATLCYNLSISYRTFPDTHQYGSHRQANWDQLQNTMMLHYSTLFTKVIAYYVYRLQHHNYDYISEMVVLTFILCFKLTSFSLFVNAGFLEHKPWAQHQNFCDQIKLLSSYLHVPVQINFRIRYNTLIL